MMLKTEQCWGCGSRGGIGLQGQGGARPWEWDQGLGLTEGPASGFTRAIHSIPLAAQEPSSSFKVLGWGCLPSLEFLRRCCKAPRDRQTKLLV